MAKKLTVAEIADLNILCMEQLGALEARLDNAATVCAAMTKRIAELESQDGCSTLRIQALEAQEVKTKKQLWFLQKIAKGDFAIGGGASKAA